MFISGYYKQLFDTIRNYKGNRGIIYVLLVFNDLIEEINTQEIEGFQNK